MKLTMTIRAGVAIAVGMVAFSAAHAGQEKVAFPAGYQVDHVRFGTLDKLEREPPIVRFFYMNVEALEAAEPGAPLPHGTVLVMEDHLAKLDGEGKPVNDANGRFVPTAEISNVFVQEKQKGWGSEYPDDVRNGEWEYAWFEATGERKAGKTMERCFECHAGVADDDYTFVTKTFVDRIKGGS